MNNKALIQTLENHPELREDLFIRAFLITDKRIEDLQMFPFYGNWNVTQCGNYFFMGHKLTGVHIHPVGNGDCFFLMGHAYDPFAMEHEEEKILARLANAYGTDGYMKIVNDLTGIFVLGAVVNGELSYLVDPAGIQSACYGKIGEHFYLSSHAQLIGDLCDLEMDDFVRELVAYKWYGRVMGPYLPGDLTPFAQVKRIVPSIYYQYNGTVSHHRYWPLQAQEMAVQQDDYEQVIREGADILRNNMILVSRKWGKPWISLTGGIDSNTTFAAGNGSYDRFETFSYISAEKEIPDAAAARKIADRFGVQHHEFQIPDTNEEVADYDAIRSVLMHNNGYVAETKHNEIRKRIFLKKHIGCDVEVKSWVSETIRAYWYKHYCRRTMPKLSPKLYRNLYKIFTTNRKLAHKVDRIFADYITRYACDRIPACYPQADIHFNEVCWGSWGGLNISEMKYCFDITIIYNNRRFLDLMFRVPLDKRIDDVHHVDMKRYLNPELYDMHIRVVNMKETKFRAFALNVIFTINSILP